MVNAPMHRVLVPHRFPAFAGDDQRFSRSGCLLQRRRPTETTVVTNHSIRNIIDNYAARNNSQPFREQARIGL
jgi:hypothetical protein